MSLTSPSGFSPAEEQFHTWQILLVNPPLPGSTVPQTRALSLWSSITITETHEGIRTQLELHAEEPSIPFIRELVTDFVFFRDQQKQYRLRVVDSEDTLTRNAATVRFDCVSYDKLFERRILHEDWLLDDGDINCAWRLIDYTQRKQTFGITRGTTQPGVRRQRALDAGDDILTAINDFAQADGGFDWWIDADLKFWAAKPRRGKAQPGLQWQLGGEVAEITRVNPIEDYASLVMATGANNEVRIPRADGQEDVYPPPDPQIVQLGAKPYGLWELTTSDTDVITTASLTEKALWHLGDKGNIRPSYKLILEPGVWQPTVALGDVFNLRINTSRANVKVDVRIEELSIVCTADGAETVSLAVRAERPETLIPGVGGPPPLPTLFAADGVPPANGRTVQRHRLDANDDLGALLRSLRKRLDRAERSRGLGGNAGAVILDGIGPPPATIGSPGNYYVDTLGEQLYGPKIDGSLASVVPTSWTFKEELSTANDLIAGSEVGWVGSTELDMEIVGFRFAGLDTASETLTVSFWDWDSGELMYRTTAVGAGSDEWIEIPPIFYKGGTGFDVTRFAVSIAGAAVPVHNPGTQFNFDPDAPYPTYLQLYGAYSGPIGETPKTANGYFGPFPVLSLLVRPAQQFVVGPEDTVDFVGMPETDIYGELGSILFVYERGSLKGWRYRKLASSSNTLTWNVWTTDSRFYDPSFINIKEFPTAIIATVTTNDEGEGEFEVRLPEPIMMDPLGRDGPNNVTISFGGEAVPFGPMDERLFTELEAYNRWYNLSFGFGYHNPVIGEYPQDMIPGSSVSHYKTPYIAPIMQQELEAWPLSNMARSGGLLHGSERVELRRNINRTYNTNDDGGLRFYEGGPSHDGHRWLPGEDVPWFSATLVYDGYSGMGFFPDDWYDTYGHTVPPEPEMYTNKYAFYNWFYDYTSVELDADLDANHPTTPGSYYLLYSEQGVWHDTAYGGFNVYGPRYGADIDAEDYIGVVDGGAGVAFEVSELPDDTTTAISRLYVIGDDGISGASLNVTPRVIQACFPPAGARTASWYNGLYSEGMMTPKGCVSPLVTAASATATAADEPWQKQFFRQMGSTVVTFSAGVGVVTVPTGMATPAVVNAQVEGVAVAGNFVVQAARTGDYTITVALNGAYSGDLLIGWTAEHAVLTFGVPAPSIDVVRNPGTMFLYGGYVDYDAGGGTWPFELLSGGHTFQDGCVLYDFTGAQVGGPFTPEGDGFSILWSAGRDWYLPGEEQQYRIQNPDEQFSNWTVIRWVDEVGFAAAAAKQTRIGEAEGQRRQMSFPNNPKMQITVDPRAQETPSRIGRFTTAEDGTTVRFRKPVGGKDRRAAQQTEGRRRREAMRPPDETTPQ